MHLSDEEQQLVTNSSPLLIELITRLLTLILQLESKIRELESKLNLNSSNSSIPSFRDPFHKPKISYSRKPTYKKPGGQNSHIRKILIPVEITDIISLSIDPMFVQAGVEQFKQN
jgi:hypothetical protein